MERFAFKSIYNWYFKSWKRPCTSPFTCLASPGAIDRVLLQVTETIARCSWIAHHHPRDREYGRCPSLLQSLPRRWHCHNSWAICDIDCIGKGDDENLKVQLCQWRCVSTVFTWQDAIEFCSVFWPAGLRILYPSLNIFQEWCTTPKRLCFAVWPPCRRLSGRTLACYDEGGKRCSTTTFATRLQGLLFACAGRVDFSTFGTSMCWKYGFWHIKGKCIKIHCAW